jgi:hypothetical protein
VVLGVAAVLEQAQFPRKSRGAERPLGVRNRPREQRFLRPLVQKELCRAAAFGGRPFEEPRVGAIREVFVVERASVLREYLGPLRIETGLGLDPGGDGGGESVVDDVVARVPPLRGETDGVLGLLTEQSAENPGGGSRGFFLCYSPPPVTTVSFG